MCVSDTHNSQPKVPDGDLLIHAGDLTQSGSLQELQTTIAWLDSLPHLHKVVVAGNHDMHLEITKSDVSEQRVLNWGRIVYLLDSSTSLRFPGGRILNLYGSGPASTATGHSNIQDTRICGQALFRRMWIYWSRMGRHDSTSMLTALAMNFC